MAQNSKNFSFVFIILLFFFLTPVQIELNDTYLAPAIFTFLFNIIFEQNINLRILRPFALSFPLAFLGIFLVKIIKKRLAQY